MTPHASSQDLIQLSPTGAELRQPQTKDIPVFDAILVVAQHWRVIAYATIGITVFSVIIVLFLPVEYTAATTLLPPAQNSSLSSALLSQLGGSAALASAAGAGLGLKNPGDTYVALFHSRTIEDAIVERFGLMGRYKKKRLSDTRDAFERHSTVVLGTKDGLIRITVWDWDPKLAADIANAYVEEYRKLSAHLALTEAAQRRAFFQEQLLDANEHLATAEEALKRTQQSSGILQIDSQSRSLIESAAQIRAQIAAKEVQLQSMRTYAADANPNVTFAKEQLSALQTQLSQLTGSGNSTDNGLIVPKGRIPEAGMEYLRRVRDVKYNEVVAELIARQFEVAKLDEAKQGAIVQVVDDAVAPDKKSAPHRILIVITVAFLTFALTTLAVLLSARFRHALDDPQGKSRLRTLRGLMFQRNG